jgi:hypothetical protein
MGQSCRAKTKNMINKKGENTLAKKLNIKRLFAILFQKRKEILNVFK